MSKHLKQVRRERKKTDRARRLRVLGRHPTSHIKHKGAMALAAAAAIASGTAAYASPVRFDNPAGPGHFDWFGGTPSVAIGLDLTLDAPSQDGGEFGPAHFRQFNGASGAVSGDGSPTFGDLQLGGAYDLFLLGVNSGDVIPSGFLWGSGAYAYYPGFGSELPENQATYLGVRFELAPAGGTHYGWIGVERTGVELDAFAWGYETDPGVSIPAGAPEPGTLALLAVGAVGLAGRRRRRARA